MVFCSQVLHETALIEAFNLKAGIEHQLKNCKLQWISFLYAYFNVFFLTLTSYVTSEILASSSTMISF